MYIVHEHTELHMYTQDPVLHCSNQTWSTYIVYMKFQACFMYMYIVTDANVHSYNIVYTYILHTWVTLRDCGLYSM